MTDARPDAEKFLDKIENEKSAVRGRLKIFLGYASGVGKSSSMFEEGRRRRERGEDVVIAATQNESTAEIRQLLESHEIISTPMVAGRAVIDLQAVLRRRPEVVLIDGLAYGNPPGSRH